MKEIEEYELLDWVCVVDESMYDKVAWFRLSGVDTKLKEIRLYSDRCSSTTCHRRMLKAITSRIRCTS